jgi:hypothetical protein
MTQEDLPTGGEFPANFAWHQGKTVGSIQFVDRCRAYLETCEDVTSHNKIEQAIAKIMSGELVYCIEMTPEQYIQENP